MIEKLSDHVTLHCGDCLAILPTLDEGSIDSVVTDPPYALVSIAKRFGSATAVPAKSNGPTGVYARASSGFMGATWDTGRVAFDPETWRLIARALKPGAFVAAFGGDRTFHRLACAIEDAGLDVRHAIAWVYGSGFPKSRNISKDLADVEWCECDDR